MHRAHRLVYIRPPSDSVRGDSVTAANLAAVTVHRTTWTPDGDLAAATMPVRRVAELVVCCGPCAPAVAARSWSLRLRVRSLGCALVACRSPSVLPILLGVASAAMCERCADPASPIASTPQRRRPVGFGASPSIALPPLCSPAHAPPAPSYSPHRRCQREQPHSSWATVAHEASTPTGRAIAP